MTQKIRCAIYDRVSTETQVKEGLSLDAQREALTDYATSHGYEIVGYYADEGITARKKMQNRRDLIRLLNDVKADKVDLILVTKLDRWFRNIKDYHNTQAILEAHNCNWKTIFEEYDTSTANGRFAINIMLSVNENECDRTSDRIKTVFEYKKNNREHINGRPGYGYATDPQKHLIKDPETEEIVNDAFSYYFTTYSKKQTVSYILGKYAGHPHCPSMYQVNLLFKNEAYAGTRYGIEDYGPAYITREQFRKIREISNSKVIPHQTEPFLFSSMIKCPVCGKNMNGFVKRRRTKSGAVTECKQYRCGAKFVEFHNGACLREKAIEEYLLDHVMEQLHLDILHLEQQEKARARKPDRSASIRAELERLNNMYQKGRIGEEYYDEQYEKLSSELKQYDRNENQILLEAYRALANVLGDGWQEMYRDLDIGHKKSFWKETLSAIFVDDATHKVCGFRFRT